LDNSSYIVLQSTFETIPRHKNKILIYDEELSTVLTSFGHTSIFWKFNDVFEKNMDEWSALNITAGNNKVFAVKEYYDGKLYLFDKNRNWETSVVEGRKIKKPGYEIVEKRLDKLNLNDYTGGNLCFGDFWGGKQGVFSIFYKYKSLGTFLFKNEYLVNFIWSCTRAKEYEFGVDVFRADGTYIGYTKIENFPRVSFTDKVLCMDYENNFYMAGSNGTIRKLKLSIN
jgi:hypothetical protein